MTNPIDYMVFDYAAAWPPEQASDDLTAIGAQGWSLLSTEMRKQDGRRAIFKQIGVPAEYLVVDQDTGVPAAELEAQLDGYGADGWDLILIDSIQQNKRRAVFIKSQSGASNGSGIEDAPNDGVTYGRRDMAWNPALAKDNDLLDGGNF